MPSYRKLLTVSILVFTLVSTGTVEANPRIKPVKARVRFIATSWVLRTTWGRNQDTYLAEISIHSEPAPFLVRLIDDYPNEFPSISPDVLTAPTGSMMRLRRDSQCELPFKDVALRTAPGDLMAILPQKLTYKPKLDRTPKPDETLQCYRTVRK